MTHKVFVLHDPVEGSQLLSRALSSVLSLVFGKLTEIVPAVKYRIAAKTAVVESPGDSGFLEEIPERGDLSRSAGCLPSADPVHKLTRAVVGRILQPRYGSFRKHSCVVFIHPVEGSAEIDELFDLLSVHIPEYTDRILDKIAVLEYIGKILQIFGHHVVCDHVAIRLFKHSPVSLYRIPALFIIVSPDGDQVPDLLLDRKVSLLVCPVVPSEERIHFGSVFLLRFQKPSGDQISSQRGIFRRTGRSMQHRQKMDRLLSLHLLPQEPQRFFLKFRNI